MAIGKTDKPVSAKKVAKKVSSSDLSDKRQRRRKFITFLRMCRYGVNNFTRNAWLSLAATAVMTVTLFVIFASVVAHNVLVDTVNDIRDKVDMSIYVQPDTPDSAVATIQSGLEKLSSVKKVTYISSEQGRAQAIQANKNDPNYLEAIKEATNMIPGTFDVKIIDINDTSQLENFVKNDPTTEKWLDADHPPSYAGERKSTIESIGKTIDFAQKVGIIASAVFIIMSILIIFNTISMAIFNRRDEIEMMKLIGADKSFIRGPFVVESIVYGFFGAIIATGLGYGTLYLAAPALRNYGINVDPTIHLATIYLAVVALALIIIGAIIGVVASLMATRRHLHLWSN